MVYIYDGTFEGFLSAVFTAYDSRENPERVECGDVQAGILEQTRYIASDYEKSERVRKGIHKKLGMLAYENVYLVFMTPGADKATLLYRYLRLGFDALGQRLTDHFENEYVMRVAKLVRRVETEIQHLKGFLRFRLIGGVFYGDFAPDNDILEAIAPHFAERYADQRFIIEDKRRNKLVACEDGQWTLHVNPGLDLSSMGKSDESEWAQMWKAFLRALTIKERVNRRQQNGMLPLRYREFMLEFEWEGLGISLGDENDRGFAPMTPLKGRVPLESR